MELLKVLSHLEQHGVLINSNILFAHEEDLTIRMKELENKAYELVGKSFNIASNKQVQKIFFQKMHMPIVKRTPSGSPSTSEEVLSELANNKNYILAKIILDYRRLAKLKNTYTNKLPKMININTGRIHTTYSQISTNTGRISSSKPNLQNIPIRSVEGRKIRQAFIASKKCYIVSADYSQIELRILAHLSNDKNLINDFLNRQDIHCLTAANIFNINLQKVNKLQRQQAKIINFGLIYGMSAFSLSKKLHISIKKAQIYMESYFNRYPDILKFMENTKKQAIKNGYITTIIGRRIYLPKKIINNNNSTNISLSAAALRAAINGPLQGTSADIIKIAMISLDKWIVKNNNYKIKMIMQVHDELVFEIEKNCLDFSIKKIRDIMENSIKLNIPLYVNIGIGKNWDETH